MNDNIIWRDPTDEEIEFIKRQLLPELTKTSHTTWSKKRTHYIDSGDFKVSRALATKIGVNMEASYIEGYIHAQLQSGEYVMCKKRIGLEEKMSIDFPTHFARYLSNKRITTYPVLLIKTPNDEQYLSVPAKESFILNF